MKNNHSTTGKIAFALGKGIIAGLAGTVAITIAQLIEMKITGREGSDAPAKAVNKVLDVEATDKEHKEQFLQQVHLTYGTLWGIARGVFDLCGLKGIPATTAHMAALWGTELVMLPAIDVAPPVKEWGGKEIAKDGLFHSIYAVTAGVVYDAID